jgi:SAM-dependent methyltransferase
MLGQVREHDSVRVGAPELDLHPLALAGFAASAEAYARGRPGYSAEAFAWLARMLALGPGRTVVDLGAGTGKLSRLLAETGARVVAVEPVEEMRTLLTGVEVLAGTAESIPLPDASADAVTAAQAFHWFRPDDALAEIHRVLRPRPVSALALVWNRLDQRDPSAAALQSVVDRYRGHAPVGGGWREAFERTTLFTSLEVEMFGNVQEFEAGALADLLASETSIAILPDERRREALSEVRALAPATIRYVTEVYVARRQLSQ